jgi:ribosome biogenesis GTPase
MQFEGFDVGRRPELAAQLAKLNEPELSGGRVLAQHRGHWLVAETDGTEPPREPRLLTARGKLRENPPGVGDWVAVDRDGMVAAVLPRHGTIMRQAVGGPTASQVLAANVDLALVVESLPDTNRRRVERLVALAVSASVPVVLVLTKADLDPDWDATAAELARELPLIATITVCAKNGIGMDDLRAHLVPGATATLLGRSGAGKSTLVNALLGEERQATGKVRAGDGRGRHVTVTRELVGLPGGALIIDTPGLREIGLWNDADDMFVEIDRLAAECRFSDCRHETEPGCAVRDAVDPADLDAWRKLVIEQNALAERKAEAADRKQRSRTLSRRIKVAKRDSRRM